MSELKVEVKASVGNGQAKAKAEAHVVPPVNAILGEIESIKAEQVEQNKAIADNLEEAKKYTDEEIATFDIIKVVNGDPETGLPLVENPLPNRFYLVPKTNTTDKDFFDTYVWANKGTEENPDYVWDFQGTKKVEVDLVEYVKFTDIATAIKAGVLKIDGYGLAVNNNGILYIKGVGTSDIDNRNDKNLPNSLWNAVLPSMIDYAVLSALTTNSLTPTEKQLKAISDWLGLVRRNSVVRNGVYGRNAGEDAMYEISLWSTGGTVARRSNGGGIRVALDETDQNPEEMATPRGYVDNNFVSKTVYEAKIAELLARIEALEGQS